MTLNINIDLPFVAGDILLIKKDYASDPKAPEYYFVRIQEIILEQTGDENNGQWTHEPVLRVVDKHFKDHDGEYVSRFLYPEFVLAVIDSREDLDELASLNLGKFYSIPKEPTFKTD